MAGQDKIKVGVEFTGDDSGFQRTVNKVNGSVSTLVKTFSALGVMELGKKAFEAYEKVMNSTGGTAEKLEQQISALDGAMSGLVRTVATGSWDSLIGNITRTAEATRDAKKSMQEYEHAAAGMNIKRGELSLAFQEARVNAAEATNAAEKQTYFQEAVDLRKQLTTVEVEEIAKRLNITKDYYKKVTGHSEEYFDYFMKQVPMLAKEYDYYFGENSVVLEGISKRLGDLKYEALLYPLTKAQEDERHQLSLLKLVLEDYRTLQDDFSKKGQWDEFIKGIGEMSLASADGEKALVRLVKQLSKAKSELGGMTVGEMNYLKAHPISQVGDRILDPNGVNGYGTKFPNLSMPTFGSKQQMPGLQIWDTADAQERADNAQKGLEAMQNLSAEMERQQNIADTLNGVFSDMFANMGKGWKAMADSAIQSIERIVEELLAKAVVLAIMNVLFPGSGKVLSFLGGGVKVPQFASGTNYAPGGISLVGERGPELVNLPKGSRVTPNSQLGKSITLDLRGNSMDDKFIYFKAQRYQLMLDQNT
jgi:hypothetical protein